MDKLQLKAPFPWFGGKSRAADLIWSRIGSDIGNYIEPFLGSCALLLNRPTAFSGWATVNDLDGNICNLWRSMAMQPDAVADAANWPINECDLHARHLALVNGSGRLAARLMADPDYCEPKLAAWWAWGCSSWIGSGWCGGTGPWSAVPDADGVAALSLGAGQGVNRQLPHLSGGRGEWLRGWFGELSAALDGVRICCGDWERIMSVGTMTRNGVCGVVLDPPYSQTDAVYANDSSTVAHDVRAWCVANGGNPKLRIALCGHEGEHHELEQHGWVIETWNKSGGYQGADDRERIWFSPHCFGVKQDEQQSLL